MIRTLLISVNDLKSNTILEQNLEEHVILPQIVSSHIIDLQEVLGDKFYENLLEKVRTETTNTNEDFLIDTYIIPYLLQISLYRCLPYIRAKMENSSIVLKETDTQKSVDLTELKYLRGDIKNDAEFLKQRLIRYLCDKSNLFPDYNNPDLLVPIKSSYRGVGIFLGNSKINDCENNLYK